MKKLISIFSILTLFTACAAPGQVGDECSSDADCAEDLECHLHDGEEDHGECEEHEDHEGEETEGEETEGEVAE